MSDKSLMARYAASPHARTGFSLLLLLFGSAVSLLTSADSQALGAQPSGPRAGVRQAQPKPTRVDHAISRIRIETPEGVFLIYDAAIPPDTDDPG